MFFFVHKFQFNDYFNEPERLEMIKNNFQGMQKLNKALGMKKCQLMG